ncbi:flippase [Shewanella indica]|uniref:flippase n=1 Tax=Shewanella indica TaxID=768528 RepID=UPI00399B1B1F
MKISSSVIRNSFWFILSKLNSLISGVVFFILLARFYPKEVIGEFTYSLTIIAVFSIFVGFGLNTSIVKYFSRGEVSSSALIKFVIVVQTILALVSVCIIYFSYSNGFILTVLSFSLLFKSSEIFKTYFDSKLNSKAYFKLELVLYSLMILLKVLLAFLMIDILYIALVLVLESFFILLLLYFVYRKDGKVSGYKLPDWETYKELILDSLPVLLTGSIFILLTKIDQIMVYNMLGVTDQAEYALASKLSEGWYFIPLGIVTSYYAVLAKNVNNELYYEYFSDACVKVNLVTIPVALFVSFFSVYIVSLIYGGEYINAASVLVVNIWNGVIIGLSSITFRHFILMNLRRYSLIRAMIGLILNVLLNYILIPLYGILGAAIATLTSQFIALFLSNLLWEKTRIIFIIQVKSLFLLKFVSK